MNLHRVELVTLIEGSWTNTASTVLLTQEDGKWTANIDGYPIPDYTVTPETGFFAPMAAETLEGLLETLAFQENIHLILDGVEAAPLIGLA